MKIFLILGTALLLAGLVFPGVGAVGGSPSWQENAPQSEPEATPAERMKIEGLPNLGRVSETLYRGAQPKQAGYPELKKLGIEIVVNLRNEEDKIAEERGRVEAQGMRYVSIPWSGWDDPDNKQVAEFLELLRANPDRKIFVHCKVGKERTGVMLATYRMVAQGWTPEQALDEMEAFGFRGFWFRHLKKYVRRFPELLKTNPHLQDVAPATTP